MHRLRFCLSSVSFLFLVFLMSCIGSLHTSAAVKGITVRTDNTTIYTTNTSVNQSSSISKKASIEPSTFGFDFRSSTVSNTSAWVNSFAEVTGYYRVVYSVQFPNGYDNEIAYSGLLRLHSNLTVNISNALSALGADQGIYNFGEPEVTGSFPASISAFSYSTTGMAAGAISSSNTAFSFGFYSGLNLAEYYPVEDGQTISFVVRVPFNFVLYTADDNITKNRLYLTSLFTRDFAFKK